MDKLLYFWDKGKKVKHGKNFHNKRKHVSTFFLSVDGMLGTVALAVIADLSRPIVKKLEEPLSQVSGWVNCWITIAVARSYSHMIRVSLISSYLWYREPEWDPGLVLRLAQ